MDEQPTRVIFDDRTVSFALASIAALVFGGLMSWQLLATLDVRERVIRIESSGFERRIGNLEATVFPPGAYHPRPSPN